MGVDQDAGPLAVHRDRAPVLKNFLPGHPGKIVMRGPTIQQVTSSTDTLRHLCSFILLPNGNALTYYREQSVSANREPWDARIYPHTLAADLAFVTADTGRDYNVISGSRNTVTHARNLAPGPYYDFYDTKVYAIGYDSVNNTTSAGTGTDGVKTQNTFQYRRNQVIQRSLSAAGGTAFAALTSAGDFPPQGACGLRFWTGRMFLGGGALWDGATEGTLFLNHLWFSNPMASVAGGMPSLAADWQDVVTAANNTILVGEDTPTDAIVGMARQGKNLVVFKRNSTHLITGAGPSTYASRQLAQDIGCIDPYSIVEAAGLVFWFSRHGYMMYDGSNITNVSTGLQSTAFARAVAEREDTDQTEGMTGARVWSTKLDAENLLVTTAEEQFDGGGTQFSVVPYTLLFHIPSRSWTQLTFDDSTNSAAEPFDTGNGPIGHATSPTGQHTALYGILDSSANPRMAVHLAKLAEPEKLPTKLTFAGIMGMDFGADAAASNAIPAEWRSHIIPLASPPYKAQVKRIMLQHGTVVDGDTQGDDLVWLVSLLDETGAVIVAEYQVTGEADTNQATITPSWKTHYQDVATEATNIQLRVRFVDRGNPPNLIKAEIYGAWVEYAPAQEPHV